MKKKLVLVTAGNTKVPIDKVRRIDNIFKGRTGTDIAEYFADQGVEVILLTSHPELATPRLNLEIWPFRNFDDLMETMEMIIDQQMPDIIIHSAAVSDYRVEGVYQQTATLETGRTYRYMEKVDSSGKISSDRSELWLRMVQTPKIVGQIREPWGFRGKLVKFKLQVNMPDDELIEVATRSMNHSGADLIVANTLEGLALKAFIISAQGGKPTEVNREELPKRLFEEIFQEGAK